MIINLKSSSLPRESGSRDPISIQLAASPRDFNLWTFILFFNKNSFLYFFIFLDGIKLTAWRVKCTGTSHLDLHQVEVIRIFLITLKLENDKLTIYKRKVWIRVQIGHETWHKYAVAGLQNLDWWLNTKCIMCDSEI